MSDWLEKLSRLISGEPQDQRELIDMLRDAESRQLLTAEVLTMIEGVLQVANMEVRDVMVPRAQMTMIDSHQSLEETIALIIDSGHSRFPVIQQGDRDEVLGLLHSKDILATVTKHTVFHLTELLRPMMVVPETKTLDALLREFRANHRHMAVVVDEYGRVTGLVTIEDVLEQIVGEIEDEYDTQATEHNIHQQSDALFIINAQTPLEEFNDYFHSDFKHDEFNTIGGVVLHQFGRLPYRSETIEMEGFQFKVLKCDKRRLYQLELARI